MDKLSEILRAIVLGAVQGLTEFLPVSSSFHLRLIPALFNWPEMTLAFSAFLHLGTLLAIGIYFGKDLWNIALEAHKALFEPNFSLMRFTNSLAFKIIVGSIPAVLVGFFLHDQLEKLDQNLYITSLFLIFISFVLLASDLCAIKKNNLQELKSQESFAIGLGQALALIPGVSRSGATISVGRFFGFKREEAARYSFLLGFPVILGAGLLETIKLFKYVNSSSSSPDLLACFLGFATAAIIGYLVIGFFLKFLENATLLSFVIYRLIVGIGALILLSLGLIK